MQTKQQKQKVLFVKDSIESQGSRRLTVVKEVLTVLWPYWYFALFNIRNPLAPHYLEVAAIRHLLLFCVVLHIFASVVYVKNREMKRRFLVYFFWSFPLLSATTWCLGIYFTPYCVNSEDAVKPPTIQKPTREGDTSP